MKRTLQNMVEISCTSLIAFDKFLVRAWKKVEIVLLATGGWTV